MKRKACRFSILLLAAFTVLGAGSCTQPRSKLAKPPSAKDSTAMANDLNVVIVSDNEVYCYEKDIDNGHSYSFGAQNSFHPYLLGLREQQGEGFSVAIKLTAAAHDQAMIDVFDEMTDCNIERYKVSALSEKEHQKFGEGKEVDLRMPTTDYQPPKVDRQSLQERPALMVKIISRRKVQLTYLDRDSAATPLPSVSNQQQLETAIERARKNAGGEDWLQVQVSGRANLQSNEYGWVIRTLQKKGIYQFEFITTPE